MGLDRYSRINLNNAIAKFQIAKRIEVERLEGGLKGGLEGRLGERLGERLESELEHLLKVHSEAKEEFKEIKEELDSGKIDGNKFAEKKAAFSFLDLKVKILEKMLESCCFCERRCEVNRYSEKGFCKCTDKSYYSSEFLHMGEEPELIPSHTIFFNRCTFRCVFCQNYDIVYHDDYPVDEAEIARIVDLRYRQGSRNVNFVGGNPDQHAHTILKILRNVESNVPVVWNSNMYHSSELAEIIEDVVDVWLGDFKYGNDECALKYSKVKNYWEIITRNFKRAEKNGELLIRHLVMPGHIECCTEKIAAWVARNLNNPRFNLMFQYYPTYKAYDYPEIARRLRSDEMREAMEIAKRYALDLVR
ncbi:MAG: radical SAM protein [Archaeoglobus sp.]|nr:radical SAM protein [Archaeoglobus sp.]